MSRSNQPSANLFVANLHFDVDDRRLEAVFSAFGAIVSAKVMVDLHTGKSRGFGFVMFANAQAAADAKEALHGAAVCGLPLSIDFSTAHTGQHLTCKSDAIYVRNIPAGTSRDAVQAHFDQHGSVKRVELLPDTAPGATTRFIVARVTYVDVAAAERAERATQCAPNVFATGAMQKVPPLLAKLAERPADRAKRLRQSRGNTAASAVVPPSPPQDGPLSIAGYHHHAQLPGMPPVLVSQQQQSRNVPVVAGAPLTAPSMPAMMSIPMLMAMPPQPHQHQQQPPMVMQMNHPATFFRGGESSFADAPASSAASDGTPRSQVSSVEEVRIVPSLVLPPTFYLVPISCPPAPMAAWHGPSAATTMVGNFEPQPLCLAF